MVSRRQTLLLGGLGFVVLLLVGAIAASFVLGLGDQAQVASSPKGSVGVAAGGAQDANAFRTNVQNGYVPQPTDISYEGLYHDYRFDNDRGRPCDERFCPTYTRATSPDPLSNDTDRYVAVGLSSGIQQSEFRRPNVTLVVVVDTSGSMQDSFSQYADDDTRSVESTTKIEAARRSIRVLAAQLGPGDRIGIVSYDDSARTVLSVSDVDRLSDERLDAHLSSLSATGGTNLAAGMEQADLLTREYRNPDPGHATRVVYVTDAMPNQGAVGTSQLTRRLRTDAQQGVHSTFVGVGVDFNTRLTDAITDVQGGNYYTVDSPSAFEDRLSEGFQYMVSPLAYDLSVDVQAPGYEIVRAYGAPSDRDDGTLIQVSTLFPSRSSDNGSEGSVILVELDRRSDDPGPVELHASYEDPDGESHTVTRTVRFTHTDEQYDTTGVRKAVALTRYATLVRNWAAYERAQATDRSFAPPAGADHRDVSQWAQQSVDLSVTAPYEKRIRRFRSYFDTERRALSDDTMAREIAILDRLLAVADQPPATNDAAEERAEAPR